MYVQQTFARTNLLLTCYRIAMVSYGETGVMYYGKTCYGEGLVSVCRLCCGLVTDLLQGDWCNGLCSLTSQILLCYFRLG